MANHGYDKGFMLLETLIAISLLSIVLTGLSWILQTSMTQLRTIENQTKNLINAHNVLETTPITTGHTKVSIPIDAAQRLECLR